jgi:general secretion pathway protein K
MTNPFPLPLASALHPSRARREESPARAPAHGALFGALWGSHDSRGRTAAAGTINATDRSERGIALPLVLAVITVLAVLVADLGRSSSTAYQVAVNERDRVRAEYLARSGLNLTRLLISKEKLIRPLVSPLYAAVRGGAPPQINIWDFADQLLVPFSNYDSLSSASQQSGLDFSQAEGLGKTGGTFRIVATPENSKINVGKGLHFQSSLALLNVAQPLYDLMGGRLPESPYDALFSERDADGQYTTRLDIVSDIIDWWDYDETRTIFDPGTIGVTSAGSEDDIYTTFRDPYRVKNAPYDSIEELRLIRGIGDDFWANFIEPDPGDPKTRLVTIYASGALNVNQAQPLALYTRLCSHLLLTQQPQPLCVDPLEAAKFIQLLSTVRSLVPLPLFTTPEDFLKFVEGGKNDPLNPYSMIASFFGATAQTPAAGQQVSLLFTPVVIPPNQRAEITKSFVTAAEIFTIKSTGSVGKVEVTITSVVNFDKIWKPPAPNAGLMPGLGAIYYYRVD